ncbi:hypothetical protein ES707_01503 [subsurface metagenome]
MPQLNKTSLGSNPAGKASGSKAVARGRKGRRTGFIIASVVITLILIIVGVSLYLNAAPFRRIIITVDNISINMDYFLMKTRLAGADPMEMLEVLTNELLIKIEAPRYVAEASPEDIDQELRRIASGESETISDSEFKEWYRQLLNEIDLSDSEYKEMVATGLLAARLQEYLAERVPTVAEQVHLHAVLLSTEEAAEIWAEEEDRDKLIAQVWQEKESEGKVEDLGWLPRGVLPPGFDETVFSLSIGDVSEPLSYTPPVSDSTSTEPQIFYYLLMVSEKAAARQIDEEPLQILQGKALDDWLLAEIKFHEVGWDFNSEIYAWINWQLTKE